MNKITDQFVYATQYYRAPTPLAAEWEFDISQMEKLGIDSFQLRIQWRWHEPLEDQYDFSELDRFFELAKKYQKKIIIKFLLENAPDYVFNKYEGTRIDMHGNKLLPTAHGAFYCGGWLPCFDNPMVKERAILFTKKVVERYKNREELILWNIWNEPSARPIGDCGCPHSVIDYRNFLKKNYGTINDLNNFFGKKWESFETITPPSGPYDFAELYLWRRWSLTAVTNRLKFMYKAVKELDSTRPVMCHVGGCSMIQDVAAWGSDDFMNAKELDFYGSSLIVNNAIEDIVMDAYPSMQCDWMRSLNSYFWIHELYPDWGAWQERTTNGDYLFKVLDVIASGAKGICYWQYRAERLGMEHNLSGLVNIDGSFKEFNHLTLDISDFVKKHHEFLLNSQVKSAKIALIYSLNSDLISRIESTGKNGFWDFSINTYDGNYLYKRATLGAYTLFRELGFVVDWVDSRDLKTKINDYELVYSPAFYLPSAEEKTAMLNFAKQGGKLILEEGIALREENSWVNNKLLDSDFAKLIGATISDRVQMKYKPNELLNIFDLKINLGLDNYASYLKVEDGKVLGYWNDNRIGAVQKDNVIYIGCSLGGAFAQDFQNRQAVVLLREFLRNLNVEMPERLPREVYTRVLVEKATNQEMLFIFNRSKLATEFKVANINKMQLIFGNKEMLKNNDTVMLAPEEVLVLLNIEEA